MPESRPEAYSIKEVLDFELDEIAHSRAKYRDVPVYPSEPAGDVYKRAHAQQLFGLALSGGGIRSATFNLGVVQAIARAGLFRRLDYISCVSGGGYITALLAALIYRRGKGGDAPQPDGMAALENVLVGREAAGAASADPIMFLRRHSNYLTPQLGLLGADTWTVIAIYVRNLFLNALGIAAAILALLLIPRVLLSLISQGTHWFATVRPQTINLFAIATWSFGSFFFALNLFYIRRRKPGHRIMNRIIESDIVFLTTVVPILLSSLAGSAWMAKYHGSGLDVVGLHQRWFRQATHVVDAYGWVIAGMAATVLGIILWVQRFLPEVHERLLRILSAVAAPSAPRPFFGKVVRIVAAAAVSLDALVMGTVWLASRLRHWNPAGDSTHQYVVLGPILLLIAWWLHITLFIGLAGSGLREIMREWCGRLTAVVMITGLIWSVLIVCSLYSPYHANAFFAGGPIAALVLGAGWLATTLLGPLAARLSPGGNRPWTQLLQLIARTGSVLVVGCTVVALAWLMHVVILRLHIDGSVLEYWREMEGVQPVTAVGLFLLFLAIAVGHSVCVGLNEFSLNPLYRNRLVRCYLGASMPPDNRESHPFINLNNEDDLALGKLQPRLGYQGPIPIWNATLNLVGGAELAWQERKAASFTFTPFFSGFDTSTALPGVPPSRMRSVKLDRNAYRETSKYSYPEDGIRIGTAMTASGAALSPNMGANSSPIVTFLLTLLNIRLGWWLSNPRHPKTWRQLRPSAHARSLFHEITGWTNDRQPYIYLSDGGHFENLGLYELIRRRCRFIICSDAAEDSEVRFRDLGKAIGKIRTDFHIDIEIEAGNLKPGEHSRLSATHCVVGSIRYDRLDPSLTPGVLLYLKSSLTGDEPADVTSYAAEHVEYPHQTTVNQWFKESQFESYRMLGEHIAQSAIAPAGTPTEIERLSTQEVFLSLAEYWNLGVSTPSDAQARHRASLQAIYEQIRRSPELSFLDAQINGHWPRHPRGEGAEPPAQADPVDFRMGYYTCTQMMSLMESVYTDLDLVHKHSHPDNQGWVKLFAQWAQCPTFQLTWALSSGNHGSRFRRFSDRFFRLHSSRVVRMVTEHSGKGAELGLTDSELKMIQHHAASYTQWPNADLELITVSPARVHGSPQDHAYTVGLILLQPSVSTTDGFAIRFAYIREPFRGMGFLRKAIYLLLEKYGEKILCSEVDLRSLPRRRSSRDSEYDPTENEIARFQSLFTSVRAQFAHPKKAAGRGSDPA